MKSEVVVGYCTFPSKESAVEICSLLVREGLIACANIREPHTAVYKWTGDLKVESETAALLKTTALKQAKLTERIRAIHPYSIPGLVFWPVSGGSPDFLKWIYSETT